MTKLSLFSLTRSIFAFPGPELSLLAGYFRWISGATDNAIYPALFLRYITAGLPIATMTRFLFTVAMTIVLAGINYSGLEIVGNLSMVVCVISMSPFIIMTVLAIPKLDVDRWLQTPVEVVNFDTDGAGLIPAPMWAGILWRPFLNILFWNLNQFDVGATFAGELRDPERVFAPAMFLSALFVWLGYLIPLLASLGATDSPQSEWEAGHFTQAATEIGGEWLGIWTIFASAISNIALFEAEMSGDAYQLLGMADRGLIPKVFAQRSRFGTPTNGILLGTFVIIAVSVRYMEQLATVHYLGERLLRHCKLSN
jgi:amino acid transporter